MKTNIPQNTYKKQPKTIKLSTYIYWFIIFLLVCVLTLFVLLSDTKTNHLEKENDLLRTELNLKTEKLFFIEQQNNHPNK